MEQQCSIFLCRHIWKQTTCCLIWRKAVTPSQRKKTDSENEIEILAFKDGILAGIAGIDAVGAKYKVKHRAEFGISILKEYWGFGIGRALINACVQCAKEAGYVQLELDVVADNTRAIALYQSVGFQEYGRNPKGFRSKTAGFQELVYMRLEL